jgi:hypothetical protein
MGRRCALLCVNELDALGLKRAGGGVSWGAFGRQRGLEGVWGEVLIRRKPRGGLVAALC